MNATFRNTIREATALVTITVGVVLAVLWHNFYIKPHDRVRMQLIECMEDSRDMSHSSYNTCVEELRPR